MALGTQLFAQKCTKTGGRALLRPAWELTELIKSPSSVWGQKGEWKGKERKGRGRWQETNCCHSLDANAASVPYVLHYLLFHEQECSLFSHVV